MVDLKAVKPLQTPVSLETIKADPRLKEMALVKFSRLSVQPVTDEEWALLCELGGLKA
jgi:predicted RNA-binding protein with PUA-like domain